MVESGLFISTILFALGLLIIIIKKNVIFSLMGVELILNASNINFVVFSRSSSMLSGEMMVIFSIVLAAAEAAIALSIVILLVRRYRSSDLDVLDELKY